MQEQKGGEIMKRIGSFLSAAIIIGSIGVSGVALASDGVLPKQELTPGSYCHMQFPAMHRRSLAGDQPMLKDEATGDIIDFYGPCDESPTGKDQVAAQRLDEQHRFVDSYD
jgi:hypothetical protein